MHVKKILIHLKTTRIMLLNQIGFWIGILSCLGVTVVGNFQVYLQKSQITFYNSPSFFFSNITYNLTYPKETNVVTVHLIGAILAFFGLLIYVWLQTFISNALPDFLYSTQRILAIRLFFCVLGTSNLVIGTHIFLNYIIFKQCVSSHFMSLN
jgi:hypothetical protein